MNPNDPRHGSNKGYAAHIAAKVDPCPPCRRAHARVMQQWQYAKLKGRRLTVPSRGVHRRIQALQRLGWTQQQIADSCGWPDSRNVRDVLERDVCFIATWRRVAQAYERLCMKLPPPSAGATKARRKAERNGWPPPLAWDDIDDANAAPVMGMANQIKREQVDEAVVLRVLSGERLPTARAEKDEIMRQWVARGGSARELARMQGWKEGRYGRKLVGGGAQGSFMNDDEYAEVS